ncbi:MULTISPECIES: Flp family type IVb pilin [Arthrobacter]|uniref:Flp family type IVb pilin n=1 Tax=Arthrobacter TaxID=1663 RepID=UPI00277D9E94|nr:Flp family type IVb pilin [Arthrobacter bambusae]MDQ0238096.1 pilus assembly protein Flp/PilA [Arthrobacter bambusae]
MKRRFKQLVSILVGEQGATATEYSILVGFIAMVIIAGVGLFGTALNAYFSTLATGVKTALGLP